MPPRKPASGDTRAAKTQLHAADSQARVDKDSRAKADVSDRAAITVPLRDQEFALADEVGIMPLMEWAAAADVDVASADGLRAVYYVLQDIVAEDQWSEFRKFARDHKVDAEEILKFCNAALEALAGRPTREPTGSSGG